MSIDSLRLLKDTHRQKGLEFVLVPVADLEAVFEELDEQRRALQVYGEADDYTEAYLDGDYDEELEYT